MMRAGFRIQLKPHHYTSSAITLKSAIPVLSGARFYSVAANQAASQDHGGVDRQIHQQQSHGNSVALTKLNRNNHDIDISWHAKSLLLVDKKTHKNYEYSIHQLRDGCQCPQCVDGSSGQKSFASSQISPRIKIKDVESTAQGLTVFTDGDLSHSNSDQHDISIPWKWIESVVLPPGDDALRLRTSPTMGLLRARFGVEHWDASSIATKVRKIDYSKYMDETGEQEALWDVIRDLVRYGLVFLKNVPRDDSAIVAITTRLASIRETFYGRTFDVRAKPDAENVAYTSGYLGLHQDLLYLSPPPQIQILHCMDNSCRGGHSLFSDADRVGRMMWHMREEEVVRDLVDVQVPYGYDKHGHLYGRQRSLLAADAEDPSRYGQVFWSPPFQKQFRQPVKNMSPWVKGAHIFDTLVNEKGAMYQTKMEPGDAVFFDNMRVLHGRTAFDVSGGSRWLRGAYIAPEDFASRASYAPKTHALDLANPGDLWDASKAERELAKTEWYKDLQKRVQTAQREVRHGL